MQRAIDIAQICGNLAVVASLFFLVMQVRLTQRQVDAARRAGEEQTKALAAQIDSAGQVAQGQNVFQLINYLERAEHLASRRRLLEAPADYLDWSKEDKEAADQVARIFQVAATFQASGILPVNWVHNYYGGAVIRYWRKVQPYVDEIRAKTSSEQRREFEELYNQVLELPRFNQPGQ